MRRSGEPWIYAVAGGDGAEFGPTPRLLDARTVHVNVLPGVRFVTDSARLLKVMVVPGPVFDFFCELFVAVHVAV